MPDLAMPFAASPEQWTLHQIVVFASLAILALVVLIAVIKFGTLYLKALSSNAYVAPMELIGMSLRNVPPGLIVDARITCKQAGRDMNTVFFMVHYMVSKAISGMDPELNVRALTDAIVMMTQAKLNLDTLEMARHVLSGGNIVNVVQALINAQRTHGTLDFKTACAADLAVKAKVSKAPSK